MDGRRINHARDECYTIYARERERGGEEKMERRGGGEENNENHSLTERIDLSAAALEKIILLISLNSLNEREHAPQLLPVSCACLFY